MYLHSLLNIFCSFWRLEVVIPQEITLHVLGTNIELILFFASASNLVC